MTGDKMNEQNKWPYVQLSKNDMEQNNLKAQMKECCVAFIDILGFKNMVSRDIDSVVLALRYIEMFCESFFKFPSRGTGKSTAPLEYRPEYNYDYLDSQEEIQGSSIEFLDVSLQLLRGVYEDECKKVIQLINNGLQSDDPKVQKKYEWLKEKYNKAIRYYLSTYSDLLDPDKQKEFFDNWSKLYAQ